MRYPSEKQMLASIFEAIMHGKNYNFDRSGESTYPLFSDDEVNELFEAFYAGYEFCSDLNDLNKIRLDTH